MRCQLRLIGIVIFLLLIPFVFADVTVQMPSLSQQFVGEAIESPEYSAKEINILMISSILAVIFMFIAVLIYLRKKKY